MRKLWAVTLLILILAPGVAFAEKDYDWWELFYFHGFMDGRINHSTLTPDTNDKDDVVRTSDIQVFEAALGAHVQMHKMVSADVVFYYTDASNGNNTGRTEELTVDEFYGTWTNWGLYAKLGKYYPPVGDFTTYGVGYTRVQDLIWTRVSALGIGYDFAHPQTGRNVFGLSGHIFNGDFDNVELKDGQPDASDDAIGNFALQAYVAPLAFLDGEDYSLELGGYFLSDATETLYGIGRLFQEQPYIDSESGDEETAVLYEKNVPLYGGYIKGELNFSALIGIGAVVEMFTTGEFDKKEYQDAAGQATAISARHAELALLIHNRNLQVGGRYDTVTGVDFLGINDINTHWEPNSYAEWGGFIGCDYIPYLHLAFQGVVGLDNESNEMVRYDLQAKVEF